MYKVMIQNVNQFYFSLQDHDGIRLSLKRLDFKVFNGLSKKEADHYKKYIPLGLSVIIEECKDVVEVEFKEVEEVQEKVIEIPVIIEEVQEQEIKCPKYNREELEDMKKEELRDLAKKEGFKVSGTKKAELIEMLVNL